MINGLTLPQRHLLSLIAIGQDHELNLRILNTLVKRGLVEQYYQNPTQNKLFQAKRYRLPDNVLLKWREWCKESNKRSERKDEEYNCE